MITQKDYKFIEARCTYNDKGNRDIEYVVIEYQGKLYLGQSNKSQHEALNNAVKSIDKDKLLELYRLEKDIKEQYQTNGSILQRQKILDDIRNVAEEIKALEEELK